MFTQLLEVGMFKWRQIQKKDTGYQLLSDLIKKLLHNTLCKKTRQQYRKGNGNQPYMGGDLTFLRDSTVFEPIKQNLL